MKFPVTFCGINLYLGIPEQLAIFARCGILSKTNVPTKFTLQVFVRTRNPIKFSYWDPIIFGTELKTCLWYPKKHRNEIRGLYSAQFAQGLSSTKIIFQTYSTYKTRLPHIKTTQNFFFKK